jgi:hypothetical protein
LVHLSLFTLLARIIESNKITAKKEAIICRDSNATSLSSYPFIRPGLYGFQQHLPR